MGTSVRDQVQLSHARLAHTLRSLTDEDARRPSLLPRWTVGHVLTHLAGNAESLVRLLDGAAQGEVADQYPGGNDRRAADIEAGAGRPAAELAGHVLASAAQLEAAFDATPEAVWRTGKGRVSSGLWPLEELPFRRWREVELHHADLDLGYGFADWPDPYVEAELTRSLAVVASRLPPGADRAPVPPADPLERRRFLAWLVGRGAPPDERLPALAPWEG